MDQKDNIEPKKDQNQSSISDLLDSIQQNSWELELLISGFAIFLLIGALEPMARWENDLTLLATDTTWAQQLRFLYYPGLIALWLLIGCLIVHVLLRGLWIAAIGLRYVSGDIDYEELNYKERFSRFLKRRIGHFDSYIERLELSCSIAFSVSFVLIFALISLSSFSFLLYLPRLLFSYFGVFGAEFASKILGVFSLMLGLLYFIDFATIGFFKRSAFTHKWYYPIYRFVGWLSLARIYRPLYHNLIDNRFGRRLGRLLPVLIIAVLVIASVQFVRSPYFNLEQRGMLSLRAEHYDNILPEEALQYASQPSLDDRYVGEDNYLEIFTPYLSRYQDPVIEKKYPKLQPGRYAGIKLEGAFNLGTFYNKDAEVDSLLSAFASIHKLYLNDSLLESSNWRFYRHQKRKQNGLIYHLPLHDLPIGEHQIKVDRQWKSTEGDSLYWSEGSVINFYR